jgi:dienelactone hydrolase
MSVQLNRLASDRTQSFLALAHLDTGKLVSLADESLSNVTIGDKGDGAVAIGASSEPYALEASWHPGLNDVYLIDTHTGARTKIVERLRGGAALSPRGKYAIYFDGTAKAWMTYDVRSGATANITRQIPYPVHDFEDDHPELPGPIANVAWGEDDKGVIVYDEFDAWLCDPAGKAAPVCVTDGSGRFWGTRLRIVDLDRDRDTHRLDEVLLLSALNTRSKASGFYRDALGSNGLPEMLVSDDCMFSFLGKAELSDVMFFTRQCFDEFPNLWTTVSTFKEVRQLTDLNPQMKDYVWGKSELVDWTSLDGVPLQGILIKPENFDPAKKYPMIVHVYERMSDQLHRHRPPTPASSTINPTMFASNGYLVFMPDIPYKIGYPGESAVNAILPGVTSLVSRGYVDPKRIGIDGHSWGGYQVSYLITRTNMFAAAHAGAPVSNMFSAYGGIRYGTGLVRQFQYERSQSRIGGTIWDFPLRFLENSPQFWLDKVQTPLLILHNDKDGAVPWTQGVELFTGLRRLGKPSWLVVYNGEDHGVGKLQNRKDWSVRLMQFFDHYLKGAPMPVWMAEGVKAVDKGRAFGLEAKSVGG